MADLSTFLTSSICGAVTGAGVTYFLTLRRAKLQTLLDLHREFNSPEFSDVRQRAHKFLRSNSTTLFPDLDGLPEAWAAYAVSRFYQRLWLLVQHRQVPRKHVGRLFGEVFFLWFYGHFERQLVPTDWQSARDVEALKHWFDARCSDLAPRWRDRALTDIERILQRVQSASDEKSTA